MYEALKIDLRFCQIGLMTLSLACLMLAPGVVFAQEQGSAEALANKFSKSGDARSATASRDQGSNTQGSGLDPDILQKIQTIKKLADAARSKSKIESSGAKRAEQSSKQKSAQAEKVAREAEIAKRKEAQRIKEAQRLAEESRLREAAELARKRESRIAARKAQVELEKAAKEKARLAKIKADKILAAREEKRKHTEELKKQRQAQAEREKAERERQLAQQRQRESQRVADAAREAAARRRDELRRLGAERRRIERNRRELDKRRKDAARQADDARKAEEYRREYLRKELEDRRKRVIEREQSIKLQRQRMAEAEKRRQFEEARQNQWQQAAQLAESQGSPGSDRNAMADRRRLEADQLSYQLRRAQGSRSQLGGGDLEPPQSLVENDRRVTILLIMNVGKKGVRRWSKTADPMLCIRDKCYLSQGSKKPAQELLRSKAFGPGVALGTRGLSCRSSPACIFREVNMRSRSASLQPVDLKFLRHDRRETRLIEADRSCTMVAGSLSCDKTFGTSDWRAWVVPEAVADWAGPKVLEAALSSGLR